MENLTEDIDFMAKRALETGILPGDFYNSSLSDMTSALSAKSRKERLQDPVQLAMQAGGFSSL